MIYPIEGLHLSIW